MIRELAAGEGGGAAGWGGPFADTNTALGGQIFNLPESAEQAVLKTAWHVSFRPFKVFSSNK